MNISVIKEHGFCMVWVVFNLRCTLLSGTWPILVNFPSRWKNMQFLLLLGRGFHNVNKIKVADGAFQLSLYTYWFLSSLSTNYWESEWCQKNLQLWLKFVCFSFCFCQFWFIYSEALLIQIHMFKIIMASSRIGPSPLWYIAGKIPCSKFCYFYQ